MINMKRYAGEKTPYELFSEAVDRKDKNSADTIALNANKHKVEIAYRYYERTMDSQKLGVNGNQKCSDFGNSECSIFGIKTTVLLASAVQ